MFEDFTFSFSREEEKISVLDNIKTESKFATEYWFWFQRAIGGIGCIYIVEENTFFSLAIKEEDALFPLMFNIHLNFIYGLILIPGHVLFGF